MPCAQPCAAPCRLTTEITAAALGPAVDLNGLARFAARLRDQPDLVRSRLHHLRSHPDRLAEIAHKSYWHHNGFAKVRMFEGHGVCVRLHIWPKGGRRIGDDGPHGHRWVFASWVAVGAGMSETYFTEVDQADPDAAPFDRYAYGRDAGVSFVRPTGPAWLRAGKSRTYSSGTVYRCSLDVLHTVVPVGDGLVATVVLQGPEVERSTPVYRPPGQRAGGLERPIEPAELDHLFGAVDSAIGRETSDEAIPAALTT